MGRRPVDDSKPPPWAPILSIDRTADLVTFCRRGRNDRRVMCFDAHDRPCRTPEDLERTIREGAFPIRVYERSAFRMTDW